MNMQKNSLFEKELAENGMKFFRLERRKTNRQINKAVYLFRLILTHQYLFVGMNNYASFQQETTN